MVVVTVFTATLAALWFIPVRWSASSLLITPVMSERVIAQRVASANVSYPAWLSTLLVRSFGGRSTIHYGDYRLDESMSLSQLLTQLTDQSGLVQHHVTFIEGWTFAQIKRALLHDDIPRLVRHRSDPDRGYRSLEIHRLRHSHYATSRKLSTSPMHLIARRQ